MVAKAVFFALPGVVAFLIAATALAVFYMDELQTKLKDQRRIRWIVAITLLLIGVGAFAADAVQKTQERTERETAVKDTSEKVASATSASVTRTVTELYSKMISDQKDQIAKLQNQLASQGKDVSAIKGSDIVTGKKPIKVEVTNPGPANQPPPQPLLSGIRIASQKQVASDNSNFPYALEVVVQTNVDISPVKLAILCDGPIGEGHAGLEGGGAYTMIREGLAQGNGNIFIVQWETPTWTPQRSMVVRLLSKTAIHVMGLSRNVL